MQLCKFLSHKIPVRRRQNASRIYDKEITIYKGPENRGKGKRKMANRLKGGNEKKGKRGKGKVGIGEMGQEKRGGKEMEDG